MRKNGVAVTAKNDVDFWSAFGKFDVLTVANVSEGDEQIDLRTEFRDHTIGFGERRRPEVGARRFGLHALGHHWDHDAEHADSNVTFGPDQRFAEWLRAIFAKEIRHQDWLSVSGDFRFEGGGEHVRFAVAEYAGVEVESIEPGPNRFGSQGYPEVSRFDRVSGVEVEIDFRAQVQQAFFDGVGEHSVQVVRMEETDRHRMFVILNENGPRARVRGNPKMKKFAIVSMFASLVVGAFAQGGAKPAPAKDMHCAVMKLDKIDVAKATAAKKFADYKGKRFFFCCEHCQEMFKKDPDKYAAKADSIPTPAAPKTKKG